MPELVAQFESLARDALLEITPAPTIGELVEQTAEEDGVVTLAFASTDPGYPGWRWTVSVSVLPGIDPTVLEVELLPGEGALLAPDWVPWSERLEEYRAAQAAAGEPVDGEVAGETSDEDDTDDDATEVDDVDELDDVHDGIDFEPEDEEPANGDLDAPEPEAVVVTLDEEASAAVVPEGDEQQDEPAAEPADDGPEPDAAPVKRRRWRRKKKE